MIPASLDTQQLIALAAALGWVSLPAGLQGLQHPRVLSVAGLMAVVEFFGRQNGGPGRCAGRGAGDQRVAHLRLLKFLKSLVRGLRIRLAGAPTAA